MIGIFGSLVSSETMMKLIFNPCSEFRRSPKGPVSQIYSPHLHVGDPATFSDLLTSVHILKREWGVRKATGYYRTYSCIVKLQPWFLSLWWKTWLWAELQTLCLSLQCYTCPWAEHSDDNIHCIEPFDLTIFISIQLLRNSSLHLDSPIVILIRMFWLPFAK